jgi:hypothetical protein
MFSFEYAPMFEELEIKQFTQQKKAKVFVCRKKRPFKNGASNAGLLQLLLLAAVNHSITYLSRFNPSCREVNINFSNQSTSLFARS